MTGQTIEKTGQSRKAIERAAKRADSILPETLDAIKGTELDKGVNLDKLAKLDADTQKNVGDLLRKGNLIAARVTLSTTATPKDGGPAFNRSMTNIVKCELNRLTKAWNGTCDETQARFLARLRKNGVLPPLPEKEDS